MSKTRFGLLLFLFLGIGWLEGRELKFDFFGSYAQNWLTLNQDSPWNPDQIFVQGERDSRLALNVEGRWHHQALRVLVSPLFTMDHQGRGKLSLREATVSLGWGKWELTAGRAIIKFGTGYLFTPIAVVAPGKQVSDPDDTHRTRLGGDLFKLDYYTENLNLSALVFKKNNWRNLALFAYGNIKGFDIYGILYYPENRRLEFGLALATTLGEAIEIHGEGMLHSSAPVQHHLVYNPEQDPRTCFSQWPLVQPAKRYYAEFLLGTNITVKQINIIAEYYHNDWGLKKEWWSRLKTHFDYNLNPVAGPPDLTNVSADLEILNQGKRGLFRDYLFVRAWKNFKNVDISTIFMINLADASFLSLLQVDYTMTDGIIFYLQPLYFSGKKGSEWGGTFYTSSVQMGFRLVL